MARSGEAAGGEAVGAECDRLCGAAVPPLLGKDRQPLAPHELAYLTEAVHPLLCALLHVALTALPERLPGFLLLWLLSHMQAPECVAAPVSEWLTASEGAGEGAAPALQPRPPASPPPAPAKEDSAHMCALRSRVKRCRAAAPPPQVLLSEAAELIRGVPLFQRLTDEEIEALAGCAEVCCFETDREVIRRGCRHEALHMIVQGEGHVSVPQVVGVLRRGDSFGEHAIAKRHLASTHTVTAGGDEESSRDNDGRLVTLALRYDDCARAGVLTRLRTKRTGLTTNVVARSGPASAAGHRRGRRPSSGCPGRGGRPAADAAPSPPACSSTAPPGASSPDPSDTGSPMAPRLPAPSRPTELSLEDRQLIIQAIRANAHFSEWLQLSQAQVEMMADMMRRTTAEPGQEVVKKGEYGNKFYIINDGILEVVSGNSRTQTELEVKVRLRSGDSFGELALLYNCPRKATVLARRACSLWVLDRRQFRAVMRVKSESRIREYERLLASAAQLGQHLSEVEAGLLVDALEESFFVRGEEVVAQADPAHVFFIVFEGCCEIRVGGEPRGFLQKGNVLWQHTLLNKDWTAVTVVVTSETATLLTFDGAACVLWGHERIRSKGSAASAAALPPAPSAASDLVRKLLGEPAVAPRPKVPWEDLDVIGALGYGSFGRVTLQRDKRTGRLYALKALSKGYIKRENLEGHVLNERKTMEMLDSKFLVHLHCTYRCTQFVYFLLDPALGGELYDVFAQNEHMFGSEAHAKFFAACCALGVQHMHDRHIIYRDLKLENVLLYSNGYACLTDLGLAKVVIGKTYTVCGTADYFAPETLRQSGHNRAVDWWALGIMLFIMMAGRSPFDAEDVMQIYRNIVKGFKRETFPPDFGEDLTDLILGLCRKKPEKRIAMAPGGCANIRGHPWFHAYAWDLVAKRTARAPYRPSEPNFGALREALERGPPGGVEFVENEADDDDENGWDADF